VEDQANNSRLHLVEAAPWVEIRSFREHRNRAGERRRKRKKVSPQAKMDVIVPLSDSQKPTTACMDVIYKN
jgi:hypothetical protein